MNAFVPISRLAATPLALGNLGITARRSRRAVLLIGLILALCAFALTASLATSASAAPDGPPIIVIAEPTSDVHDPPIDDKAPVPTPEPTTEPLDDKAPPPVNGPGAGIEITKAECAPDYEVLMQSLDEHIANCQGDGAGFVFHLVKDGQDIAQDTVKHNNSAQGFASWIGFAPGPGQIAEEIPVGYLEPLVYCQLTLADGAPQGYESMADTLDGSLDFLLLDGERLHCYWFNLPTTDDDNQPGTLIIYKYLCDGDVYSAEACQPTNAEFMLASATGEGDPVLFVVGADGVWSMDLPDGGFWELTELNADYCWIQSADFTGGGTLPTTSGHETVVEVFNCTTTPNDDPNEPGDEPGEPEITTLPDTGSGPGVRDAGIMDEAAIAALILLTATVFSLRRTRFTTT